MGRKKPSWLVRACGGGNQAETAKRSIDLASAQVGRSSTLNSLYVEDAHGGKPGKLATQLADLSLDDLKTQAQESYATGESVEGHGNVWMETDSKLQEKDVAVRCYLKANGSRSGDSTAHAPVDLAGDSEGGPDSSLVADDSLCITANYDKDLQAETEPLGKQGVWEPLTDMIDCVKDWQEQVREMKSRTQEIEASCMRGKYAESPNPSMMRISTLEARCRHVEDENLKLRVQVNEYEKQCGLLIHRNSKYAELKRDLSVQLQKSIEKNSTLEETTKQLLSRAEHAEARATELWGKIHDLEDSINRGIELHTLRQQLKDAKRQLAVFEADIQTQLSSATNIHQSPTSGPEHTVPSHPGQWPEEGLMIKSRKSLGLPELPIPEQQKHLMTGMQSERRQSVSPLEEMVPPHGYDSSVSMHRSSEGLLTQPSTQEGQPAAAGVLATQQVAHKLDVQTSKMGGEKAEWYSSQPPQPGVSSSTTSAYVPLQAQWTPQLANQVRHRHLPLQPASPAAQWGRPQQEGTRQEGAHAPPRRKAQAANHRVSADKKKAAGGGRPRHASPASNVATPARARRTAGKGRGGVGSGGSVPSPRGAMAAQLLTARSSARKRLESSKNSAFR